MKIGITYTGSPEKQENYLRWLKAGGEMELIRLSAEDNNADAVQHCDAVVFTGGVDVHPRFYKSGKTDYPNRPDQFNEARDEFELAVFHTAQQNRIPVLGICRGFQLINCALGGSLEQDLGDVLNKIHRAENRIDKAHGLHIEPGTLMNDIAQAKRSVVNSAHHQAVNRTADELKANCFSDDGTIEGFEWADPSGKPFLLGMQCHPERMYTFGLQDAPLSLAVRKRFIEEIKKSIANRS